MKQKAHRAYERLRERLSGMGLSRGADGRSFVKDKEIDQILKQAAQAPHDVDPALLDRVARSIGSSLRPVRPLPPAMVPGGRAGS